MSVAAADLECSKWTPWREGPHLYSACLPRAGCLCPGHFMILFYLIQTLSLSLLKYIGDLANAFQAVNQIPPTVTLQSAFLKENHQRLLLSHFLCCLLCLWVLLLFFFPVCFPTCVNWSINLYIWSLWLQLGFRNGENLAASKNFDWAVV